MPLSLFEKNVLFQAYRNFERLNNMYVFEFYRAEVLLNFFVYCSSAYLDIFYRSLVDKSLYQVLWKSREIEDSIPVCNIVGKISMYVIDSKHNRSQNEDGMVSCSMRSRPMKPRGLSESK